MPARAATALVLLLSTALLAASAASASPGTLRQRLTDALRVAHVDLASAGAMVVDLETGQVVYAHNATRSLLPASNEKLAITYAALTALGPAFRIETDVLGDGARDGSTWRGDLVLKGYGDPTLTRAGLRSLANQVRAAGITRVTGRILGDESWFDTHRTAPGWKASFYRRESPPLSALVVNRGWDGTQTTAQPALQAAQLFALALARAGVQVAGAAAVGVAPDAAVELAAHDSPPVATLVRLMDRYSDNFSAELLLKELGAVQGSRGSTAAGIRVERSLLAAAGVPLEGVRLADGSGLSRGDRWTPAALVALLRAMWDDPGVRPVLFASLPVAGRSGTLVRRMRTRPARGLVRAKTGTTDNATALSGFVGDRYVFSILENGRPVWWGPTRLSQDRFATVLAAATVGG